MIKATTASEILTYLKDCELVTVSATKAAVWADYLNDPKTGAPDTTNTDLKQATRQLVALWSKNTHYRKPTPADLVAEIKKIRHKRIDDWNQKHGPLTPPAHLAADPKAEQAWLRQARHAIANGQTPQNALERDENTQTITEENRHTKQRGNKWQTPKNN